MSAGHGHTRANLRHPKELAKLLTEGGALGLMNRWERLDVEHDIPDLAGYNVAGAVRYLDQDVFRALFDPDYATKILGAPIDTGLTPEQTVTCIIEHEGDEKVLLDADNNVDTYQAAHEFATTGEHERVKAFGGTPVRYERGLASSIAHCAKKDPKKLPLDLACAPLLDDPDKNDVRVLKLLRRAGVTDAFKAARRASDYGRSTGADQCRGCASWQGDRSAELSPCDQVDGLVRADRWCKLFEAEAAGERGGAVFAQ